MKFKLSALGKQQYLMALYRFPCDISRLLNAKSKDHIDSLVAQEHQRCGFARDTKHLIEHQKKGKFLRFCCNIPECKWRMIFREKSNNQGYRLVKIIAIHCHLYLPIIKQCLTFNKKSEDLSQPLIHQGQICKYLQINYNMSTKQFIRYSEYADDRVYGSYGILLISNQNRKRRNHSTIQSLKNLYTNLGKSIFVYCKPELEQIMNIPEFIFMTTTSCNKIYKAKGQIVEMVILSDKVTETYENGQRMICVVFYGLLANYQCVLFAIAVYPQKYMISKKGKIISGLYQAMNIFFNKLGPCQTFVTQADSEIVKTTKYFIENKYPNIVHLIDPYDYVYKKFPDNLYQGALKIILAQSDEEYSENSRKWFENNSYSEYDRKIMSQCLKAYGSRSIYSHRPFFIAGILLEDANYKIKHMLRHKINQQTLGKLLQQFVKMTLKIDKLYEKKQLSIIYLRASRPSILTLAYPFKIEHRINQDPQFIQRMKDYRNNLYKQGFSFFLGQMSRTGETDFIKMEQPDNQINFPLKIQFLDIDNKIFICTLEKENKKYDCSCDYTKFWGIPCKHICKLEGFFKFQKSVEFDISVYISKYWKLQMSYTEMRTKFWLNRGVLPPKQGPPKKSNRNIIK